MKSGTYVFRGGYFDDAAEFSAVLGRKVRGIDAHGLHVVGFNFGAEAGRAIVRKRHAVHYELRLILRTPRVQYGVALVEPARLGIHQVYDGAAWQGGGSFLDSFGANAMDGAGAVGVDEGVRVLDGDRGIHGREAQDHMVFGGD